MYAVWVEALKDFFGRARHAREQVPVISARPDRAFEELARIMKRRRDGARQATPDRVPAPASLQASTDRPAAVPFCSVWLRVPRFDAGRHSPARVVVARDRASGSALVMRYPRPLVADLQVELVTETEQDAWDIEAQLELLYQAEAVFLPIDWSDAHWYRDPFNVADHARVMGRQTIKLTNEGWTDNSAAEESDGPKLVRHTFAGKVYGTIPYRPDEARLVRTVAVEIMDNTQDPAVPIAAEDLGSED